MLVHRFVVRSSSLVVSGLVAFAAPAIAQEGLGGGPILVNTETAGAQQQPDTAILDDGTFMVVWESLAGGEGDVRARLFDDGGVAVGSDFLVHAADTAVQNLGRVAATSSDEFVVAWRDEVDGAYDVAFRAQRFDTGASPVGAEFRIDETGGDTHGYGFHAIGAASDGSLLSFHNMRDDATGLTSLVARRFDATNDPVGDTVVVAEADGDPPGDVQLVAAPSVARVPDGYLLAWSVIDFTSPTRGGGFNPDYSPRARVLLDDGTFAGPERTLSFIGGIDARPVVASLADGRSLAVWETGSGDSVQAQRLSASGSKVGGVFDIALSVGGAFGNPAVAASDHGFIAVWQDAVDDGVHVRAIDADGALVGDEGVVGFQPATHAGGRSVADVALSPGGEIAIAWTAQGNLDGDGLAILAVPGSFGCTDVDGDGFALEGTVCGPVDCDDGDPAVNPDAAEIPGNGVDDDCDPSTPAGCQQERAFESRP